MSEWIDPKIELPAPCIDVLIDTGDDSLIIGYYASGEWHRYHDCCGYHGAIHEEVKYWQPLPKSIRESEVIK